MKIETHRRLGVTEIELAWKLYVPIFAPLAKLAVQRHLMTWGEFSDCMKDGRISKYLAYDGVKLVGLGVQTKVLQAWPLISPDYFAYHWADLFRDEKIWYVGFVGVKDRSPNAFTMLLTEMSKPAREARGMTFMDFCSYNEGFRRLPVISESILRRIHPSVNLTCTDREGFWAADFTKDPG
jgi:hypothetical protein